MDNATSGYKSLLTQLRQLFNFQMALSRFANGIEYVHSLSEWRNGLMSNLKYTLIIVNICKSTCKQNKKHLIESLFRNVFTNDFKSKEEFGMQNMHTILVRAIHYLKIVSNSDSTI